MKAYAGRHEVKTPDWMTALQEAEPGSAFKLGLSLILLMPTDIIVAGDKAERLLPRIREWMNQNSWLISIIVYAFFIHAYLS